MYVSHIPISGYVIYFLLTLNAPVEYGMESVEKQ